MSAESATTHLFYFKTVSQFMHENTVQSPQNSKKEERGPFFNNVEATMKDVYTYIQNNSQFLLDEQVDQINGNNYPKKNTSTLDYWQYFYQQYFYQYVLTGSVFISSIFIGSVLLVVFLQVVILHVEFISVVFLSVVFIPILSLPVVFLSRVFLPCTFTGNIYTGIDFSGSVYTSSLF